MLYCDSWQFAELSQKTAEPSKPQSDLWMCFMVVYMYARVFVLKPVMHLSFPGINRRLRITLLQVQTNSMSANYCQILPLLSDSLTGSTVIFFFFVSLSDMNVFLKVWNWCLAEDWKCPPLLHPGQKYNYTWPELWDMLLHSHTAYARWIRREFCL